MVDAESGPLSLMGFAVAPAYATHLSGQYVFVNGRFVRDRVIGHALREAYRDVLHHDRQPSYALWLALDPHLVDVNVHPQKSEVRFRESGAVHQFVLHAVTRALATTGATQPAVSRAERLGLLFGARAAADAGEPSDAAGTLEGGVIRPSASGHDGARRRLPSAALYCRVLREALRRARSAADDRPDLPDTDDPHPLGFALAHCTASTCSRRTTRRVVLVDMHAAHERIVYERLERALDASVPVQPLLVPMTFAASPLEVAAAEEHAEILDQLVSRSPSSVPRRLRTRHSGAACRRRRGDACARGAGRAPRVRRQRGAGPRTATSSCRRWLVTRPCGRTAA